ncbi:vWA domain-containing protein [Spirochaeta cellobiosiphila]|uniref:vWA domain-containing protein n=1 Tax=Spirochaeta cellobiosiphila TaxID=504483 RepID=UPI00040B7FB1|nr:VWA domain-containing protein [Spirochaeta cellobiosiphila]
MIFIYPESLWYLFIIPVLILLFVVNYYFGKKSLIQLMGMWRSPSYGELYFIKKSLRALTFTLGLVFIILGLAEHPMGQQTIEEERQGVEIAFVVDLSRSMLVEDVGSSRLDKSRQLIQGIMNQFPDYEYSLTGFKGTGSLFIPMTEDKSIFSSLLGQLSTDLITTPGTNIEEGLEKGIQSFPAGRDTYRGLVLFSDGEELSGKLTRVVKDIKAKGVEVFVVGIGSQEGGYVPDDSGDYVTDRTGDRVKSMLVSSNLISLARDAEGEYVSGKDIVVSQELSKALNLEDSVQVAKGVRLVQRSSYPLYVSLSLLCFLLFLLTGVIRWKNLF